MNRYILTVSLAVAYAIWRLSDQIDGVKPVAPPTPAPVVTPVTELSTFRSKMSSQDRESLSQAYEILSRSVAANTTNDPAFPTVGSVRAAHRAALQCVWRGVLGNQPGKYEGLAEALEGAVEKRVGKDDIPLNPTIQQQVVQTFADIAASLR
jgi:hypothetical protein